MRVPLVSIALLIVFPTAVRAVEPAPATYVGSGSCATFGCHGNTATRGTEAWKSSFIHWTRNDPHAGAFEVLFTERSAKMVELLTPIVADDDRAGRRITPTNTPGAEYEANYWSVLERSCIGCHATPGASSAPSPTTDSPTTALRHGVSCESCHGAASKWLTEHATSRWTHYSPAEKADRWGMTDTKSLRGRLAVCVECHAGPHGKPPNHTIGVDHDLIAAGHPRLMFEFDTYLKNLPAHWDVQKDIDRHAAAHGSNSFHFDAWRFGLDQTLLKAADRLAAQVSDVPANNRFPAMDFANYDCYKCHHQLSHQDHRESAVGPLDRAAGELRSTLWTVDGVQSLLYRDDRQMKERLTVAERIEVLVRLAALSTARETANWDRAVQFYLANRAFIDDLPKSDADAVRLKAKSQDLFNHLNSRFTKLSPPTIYDSPDTFDPTDPTFRTYLRAIASELESMHAPSQK